MRPGSVSKNFYPKLSHRILWHMHGVLNIDEKKLIAQFSAKSRDESFKPNQFMKSLKCYSNPTCANYRLISIIRFVSQFPDGFCNLFFLLVSKNPFRHPFNTSDMTPKKFSPPRLTLNAPKRHSRTVRITINSQQDQRENPAVGIYAVQVASAVLALRDRHMY